MRHNVHLFLGSEFKATALNLMDYVLKYGEGVSPYFNVLLLENNEQQETLIRQAESSMFEGDSQNNGRIILGQPVSIGGNHINDELSQYFNQLFRKLVTITNPGDSPSLLLTIYIPLFLKDVVDRLDQIVNAVKECNYTFEIDIIGIGNDLKSVILLPSAQNREVLTKTEQLVIQQEVFRSVLDLKRDNRALISHVIPVFNVNSKGYALNLNGESFVRMIGELAIIFVSQYNSFMRQVVDDDNRDITAIGMSQIYLDEYYFTQYLQHKAFLHVLDRENVIQDTVDLNKIAPIAQKCLLDPSLNFDVRTLFSKFWEESKVENLLAQGYNETQIIAQLSPGIDKLFDEELPDRIQSFIPDESLSLPERKCILALLLGQDDEQFYNDLFDDNQLFIDDIINEPLRLFVEENNRHKQVEVDEDGNEIVTHAVLDAPLDVSKDVYIPLEEIRKLKKKILSSSKYIRVHKKELEELDSQVKESKETDKRLSPNGYKFNDTIYKLQYDVTEHALQEDYVAHDPTSKSVDLRSFFSDIRNQGEEGACASFAAVSVFEYFQHRYGISENSDMSPAFAYYNARLRNGRSTLGKGSSIADNIEAMHDHGVCHEEKWPYSKENIDQKPSEEAFNDAKSQTVLEAANVQIDADPDVTLRNMKSALCDGYPVLISLKVYDSFSAPNGFVPHPTEEELASSADDARHALVLCGYSDEHRFFIARNSWGKQFGDKGYCYIPYSYISNRKQCECAFVIKNVTPNKSSFIKVNPANKISFNTTDIAIRRAVINNLVAEEKVNLLRLKKRYDATRKAFEHLFKKLCNNSTRTAIKDLADQRLQSESVVSTNEIKTLQSQRVEECDKHKKTTRNQCIKAGIAALVFLIASYFPFTLDFSYHKHIGYGMVLCAILLILFIILYVPYRRSRRKQLEQQFMDQINYITDKRTKIESKQSVFPIQLHLAGAFLEQFDRMRNQLTSKYNCMLSFVGNLNEWYKEEMEGINVMSADSRPPFIAVLDNDSLDDYFLHQAQQATSDIHLADFFNQGYTLDKEGIINFWHSLNSRMREELMKRLEGFSMLKYILNEEDYPYLPHHVKASELLPTLEDRSKTFVKWHQYGVQTPEAKYIMLHFEDDIEESKWWSKTSDYFQNRPLPIPIDSKYKLIMLEIKNLTSNEMELT
jgi:C1A family cysteine protease